MRDHCVTNCDTFFAHPRENNRPPQPAKASNSKVVLKASYLSYYITFVFHLFCVDVFKQQGIGPAASVGSNVGINNPNSKGISNKEYKARRATKIFLI